MDAHSNRLIGKIIGDPGPTICFLGGVHGNEPAGVFALEKIFAYLQSHPMLIKGTIVGLRGNIAALKEGKRFLEEDLNRLWSPERIDKVLDKDIMELSQEEVELKELLAILLPLMQAQQCFFFDLHTTSAPGGIFSIATPPKENTMLAKALHAPLVTGLADHLAHTTNAFINHQGIRGMAFESGQHLSPSSVSIHEAAIWIILEQLGCIEKSKLSFVQQAIHIMKEATKTLPTEVKVVYRHEISPEDQFRLNPGFKNFDSIEEGQLLGFDVHGEIRAPRDGLMLMPLYQAQGEEGFFIVEAVSD